MTRRHVHPVLAAALAAFRDEDVPDEVDRALPAQRKLSTHELLNVASLCVEHARPRVGRTSRAEFDRLAALAERQRVAQASYAGIHMELWQRDLAHVERDLEYARGALVVAALAAHVAWLDFMRGGREAAVAATRAVERTAHLLRADAGALQRFVLALCRAVA